jgi:uncharacterized membrane protein YkoI
MTNKLKGALIAVGVIAVLAAGGAAIAGATGGGDDDATDQPITGPALAKAKAVALGHTGGGQVTATEVRDEEGYYEIEVKRDDGSQVDVHLDRNFHVIGGQADDDGSGAAGSGDD